MSVMQLLTRRELARLTEARHFRDQTIRILQALTDEQLEVLVRRGQLLALPDGHSGRTLGDGTPAGNSDYAGVEAMVDRLAFPNTPGVPRLPSDMTGDSIRLVFDELALVATAAFRIESARNDINRHSTHGRIPATAGPCLCCSREVAGSESDRLRAGLCDACRKAWVRDGRPERAPWIAQRRVDLAERDRETVA